MKKQILLTICFSMLGVPIFAKKDGYYHTLKKQIPEAQRQMIFNIEKEYDQKEDQIQESYRSQKKSLDAQIDQVKKQIGSEIDVNTVTSQNTDLIIQYLKLKQERSLLRSTKKCETSVLEKEKTDAVQKIIIEWLQSIKAVTANSTAASAL